MKKNRVGWVIAVVLASMLTLFMSALLISALSERTAGSDPQATMTIEGLSAYCYKASALYCAGIYYTEEALTMDPRVYSYDEWQETVEKAESYWDALNETLEIIIDYVDSKEFEDAYDALAYEESLMDGFVSYFSMDVHAIDSAEIIATFDSAKAGNKIKAVAKLLNSDMKYAYAAFKVANGEITAKNWNDFGDTALRYEQTAQALIAAGKGAAVYVGAVTGGAATALGKTVLAINGASAIWQAGDAGAFIAIGEDYKSNEFIINLNKVSDAIAPVAFVGDMLTLNFTSSTDKIMSTLTIVDTIRGLIQDGKVASIQITGEGGIVTSLTKQELLDYKAAKDNGQTLPKDIEALIKALYDTPEPIEFKVNASKTVLEVDEKVTFTVEDAKDYYSFVWKYGNNENSSNKSTFEYMYQVPGMYTMSVDIIDVDGQKIGIGLCSVEVKEPPEDTDVEDTDVEVYDLDVAGSWRSFNDGTFMVVCDEIGSFGSVSGNAVINEYSATLDIESNGDYVFTYAENYPDSVKWSTLEGNGLEYTEKFTFYGLSPVLGSDGYLYLPTSGGEGYYIFE